MPIVTPARGASGDESRASGAVYVHNGQAQADHCDWLRCGFGARHNFLHLMPYVKGGVHRQAAEVRDRWRQRGEGGLACDFGMVNFLVALTRLAPPSAAGGLVSLPAAGDSLHMRRKPLPTRDCPPPHSARSRSMSGTQVTSEVWWEPTIVYPRRMGRLTAAEIERS